MTSSAFRATTSRFVRCGCRWGRAGGSGTGSRPRRGIAPCPSRGTRSQSDGRPPPEYTRTATSQRSADEPVERSAVAPRAAALAISALGRVPHQPGRKTGTRRARQHVRRDHGESDCQRQRNEQLPADARHEERGTNTARMQNIESSRAVAVLAARFDHGARPRKPGRMCVWMFSISTVASSTSTPTASASPPSVMMLIVCPVSPQQHDCRQQRERNIQ